MFDKGGEVKRKIRVVKVKTLDFYWLHDVADLDRMINSPLVTIESFDDLLSYRINHWDEDWEFSEDFPEEEKLKLKYLIPTELCDFNNEMIKAKN